MSGKQRPRLCSTNQGANQPSFDLLTHEKNSQIRQVPDNQEVYLDNDGLSSIVFDILERVDKPDLDALKYHLEDVVEDDVNATKLWTSNSAVLSKLP
jgi:hypothetical protein